MIGVGVVKVDNKVKGRSGTRGGHCVLFVVHKDRSLGEFTKEMRNLIKENKKNLRGVSEN